MSHKHLLSIIAITGMFLSLGLISAEATQNAYSSEEIQEGIMGGMGSLAADKQNEFQDLESTSAGNVTTGAENVTATTAPTNDTSTVQ